MKMLMLILVLFVQGCGTMRGVGSLIGGIGSDIQQASDGYNEEYYMSRRK